MPHFVDTATGEVWRTLSEDMLSNTRPLPTFVFCSFNHHLMIVMSGLLAGLSELSKSGVCIDALLHVSVDNCQVPIEAVNLTFQRPELLILTTILLFTCILNIKICKVRLSPNICVSIFFLMDLLSNSLPGP